MYIFLFRDQNAVSRKQAEPKITRLHFFVEIYTIAPQMHRSDSEI